jgi:hypothetical protein
VDKVVLASKAQTVALVVVAVHTITVLVVLQRNQEVHLGVTGLMEALVTVAKTTLVVAVAVELAVAAAMVLEVVVVLAVQAVNLLLQEQPLTTLAVVVELEIMVEQVVEQVAEAMLTNLELPILEAVVVAIILAAVQE